MSASSIRIVKPRILVSGLSNSLGGTEIVVGRYIKAMRDTFDFDFLATSNLSSVPFTHQPPSNIIICPDVKSPVSRKKYLSHFFREKADTYHAVWCNFNHLLYSDVLHFARAAGIPVRIAHAHNSQFLGGPLTKAMSRLKRRRTINDSTIRLGCSLEAGYYFWNDSFQVLPNALDFSEMAFSHADRESMRRELGYKPDDFVIASVGRLTDQKNHSFLIRVMPLLLHDNPLCKLVIVGDGPLARELASLVEELNLSSQVKLLGARTDIAKILSASDCFAFPSKFEGLGVAAVEAQINGLPCVCSEGVPDSARISAKFLKLPFVGSVWAEAILSMNRPNELQGGRLSMTSTPKPSQCERFCSAQQPLVSVVVPMFNAERTIEGTINSVQTQVENNIEIIVIDDGSTDHGAALVSSLADKDDRITLIRQKNAGVAEARNRGIRESSAAWLMFLDADDLLPKTAISSLLKFSEGLSVVVGALRADDSISTDSFKELDWNTACSLCLAFWDNTDDVPFDSYKGGVAFRSVCGKLFRTSFLQSNSLFLNGVFDLGKMLCL